MNNNINKIIKDINESIAKLGFNQEVLNLYEPIKYALDNGGKRIRPLLMLLAYQLFKDDYHLIMKNAIALEIYHNFTLLHDDVMDKADVRRGKPCVHVKWNENTAILSGDAMLILAYKLMTEDFCSGACDTKQTLALSKAIDTFNNATLGVCEGQQLDMDFENLSDVNENQYMEMIRLKTSLLLSSALKIGAQLAQANDSDAQLLYDFGEKIGLAFQLQDDLLDVYADEKVFGKMVGGDIAKNKKTFMLIKTMQLADNQQYEQLMYWLNLKSFVKHEKFLAVKKIYDDVNIADICREKIEELFMDAMSMLDNVDVPEYKKEDLKLITSKLMNRNS